MLVKRDTSISGIFDADSAIEATDSSGVPTPRGVPWSNDHLTGSDPLPIVTAKTEPTQRGLGIPPPPSSREVSWHSPMPAITSLSPLSLDAFDEGAASPRTTDADVAPSDAKATENERITVRAPPPARGKTSRQRRRALSVVVVATAAVLVSLVARRATLGPDGVSAAAASAPMSGAVAKVAPAFLGGAAIPAPPASSQSTPETPSAAVPPSALPSEDPGTKGSVRTTEPASDALPHKRRRSRTEARASERASAATSATPVVEPGRVAEPGAPVRPTLSLPPR
jgi:hypothetical protein